MFVYLLVVFFFFLIFLGFISFGNFFLFFYFFIKKLPLFWISIKKNKTFQNKKKKGSTPGSYRSKSLLLTYIKYFQLF
ncbi:hypothetical protein BSQ88_00115 [Fusobacterium necrophorum subsp. funduliforme]|nr:hypothetical protein BSQ88_00115 [Fusobacterium necrophorum subsp. funduliforme]